MMDQWGLCFHEPRFATMHAVYPDADFGEQYGLARGLSMVRQLYIRGMPYMAWLRREPPRREVQRPKLHVLQRL